MLATKVFQNGNSQAIRIPQDLRTEKKDYYIRKLMYCETVKALTLLIILVKKPR